MHFMRMAYAITSFFDFITNTHTQTNAHIFNTAYEVIISLKWQHLLSHSIVITILFVLCTHINWTVSGAFAFEKKKKAIDVIDRVMENAFKVNCTTSNGESQTTKHAINNFWYGKNVWVSGVCVWKNSDMKQISKQTIHSSIHRFN